MNNSLKKTIASLTFILLMLFSSITVFAISTSYDSYYDITSGVFTKPYTYSKTNNGMSIALFPDDDNPICNMDVMVMKKIFWGYEEVTSIISVSANDNSYTSFTNLPTNVELAGFVASPTKHRLTGDSTITFWEQ